MIPNKEEYVERLFASISRKYDLLNTILSFNCHKYWRRFAVEKCELKIGDSVLDVASGTMDFAIEISRHIGDVGSVTAVDFCMPMLEVGMRKIDKLNIDNIFPVLGNAECLPFVANSFNAAVIGFGMRNVSSVENVVKEMTRVVKPGGKVVSLELAKPLNPMFRFIYNIYFYGIIPKIGGLFNGKAEPYKYLPASLTDFCTREQFSDIMINVGLIDVKVYNLTGGIVAIHSGTKV